MSWPASKVTFAAALSMLSSVCCSGLLSYDELGFGQNEGEWSHWTPEDGATGYEVSAQDVPAPLNPACMQSSVALVGELDGAPINMCYARSWHEVDQSVSPATMDVEFGTEGKVHLQWAGLLSDGMGTPATGTLKMPAEGPNGGKTYCVDAATFAMFELGPGKRVYAFALSKLSSGASCPGTAVAGSLQGDFRTQ